MTAIPGGSTGVGDTLVSSRDWKFGVAMDLTIWIYSHAIEKSGRSAGLKYIRPNTFQRAEKN